MESYKKTVFKIRSRLIRRNMFFGLMDKLLKIFRLQFINFITHIKRRGTRTMPPFWPVMRRMICLKRKPSQPDGEKNLHNRHLTPRVVEPPQQKILQIREHSPTERSSQRRRRLWHLPQYQVVKNRSVPGLQNKPVKMFHCLNLQTQRFKL